MASLLDTLFDAMLDNGNTYNTLLLLLEVAANRRGYTGDKFSYVDALLEAKARRKNEVVFDEPTTQGVLRSAKVEAQFKQEVDDLTSRIQHVRDIADSPPPENDGGRDASIAEYRDEVAMLATETDGHPYLKMFLKGLRNDDAPGGVRPTKASRLRQQRFQQAAAAAGDEGAGEDASPSASAHTAPLSSRRTASTTPRAESPRMSSTSKSPMNMPSPSSVAPPIDDSACSCPSWTISKHSILRGETGGLKKKQRKGEAYVMFMKKTAWHDRATHSSGPTSPRSAAGTAALRSASARSPSPRGGPAGGGGPATYRRISNTPAQGLYQPRAPRKTAESQARERRQKDALQHHPQSLRSLPRPSQNPQNRA